MRTEDGYIIRECLNGDSASFGLLVDKYKESIYALAYSRLRNFHDAEDVTQDAFMKAYKNVRTLRSWDSFLVWLRSITINLCKDKIRKQARSLDGEFIEDQKPGIVDKKSADFYQDEQSSISHEETLSFLGEALRSLPEAYQQVLTLHYLGGMGGKQISKFLGISHANVRQRLSRARRQLREEVLVMMSSTYEQQRLPVGFTFRIVEAVKQIKVSPMPRAHWLPWGLSLGTGIVLTVLSFFPQLFPSINITADSLAPSLPGEVRVSDTGEIPIDILKISEIPFLASQQGAIGEGVNNPDSQNAIFLAPRVEGDKWTRKADMPTARSIFSTSVVGGKIYAIGGTAVFPAPISTVEEYDPVNDSWVKKANMPTPRNYLSVSTVNGKIYAIGGWRAAGNFPRTVEEYDPMSDTWIEKANMPTARSGFSTSVVNGKIYAIGGWKNVPFPTVEEYDPVTDTWTKKANMPTTRWEHSASVVNGKIYAIGGRLGTFDQGPPFSIVEEYDPVTDTWTEKTGMPTPRWGLSTSVVNGKIYAIGGTQGGGSFFSVVEEYDPVTDTWTKRTDIPTARNNLSTSAVNGKIYAIGGATAKYIYTSSVEEYDPWFIGEAVEPSGKLGRTWGDIKHGR